MANAAKPIASLSLDLDNQWSYMKTHGDDGWQSFPSYLDVVVPRILDMLAKLDCKITFFIVGQDAALEKNKAALKQIAAAGHDIGNHSFKHEPWLHLYSRDELEAEIGDAEAAIASATGVRPRGFRGPGFSVSADVLDVLLARGYAYDASTFPTFLGPVARAYYFFTARLSAEQRAERKQLFGGLREGLRPLKPYRWELPGGSLLEIPVTTMPIARAPFHLSYVLYAAGYSRPAALAYFGSALTMCRTAGIAPSVLLHPLDFLSGEDVPCLRFFPAMDMPTSDKLAATRSALAMLGERFETVTMAEHARRITRGGERLSSRPPRFAGAAAGDLAAAATPAQ